MTEKSQFVAAANIFQIAAHGACGQKRKFSGNPYHVHPQAVHDILVHHYPWATDSERAAALLHDVIEDTKVPYELISSLFGQEVADFVLGLTNVKVKGYNRARQKRHDAERLAGQSRSVKRIKLADRLHNLPDIIANDPNHAKVYVPETRYLIDTALSGVNDIMWNKLDTIIKNYYVETQNLLDVSS